MHTSPVHCSNQQVAAEFTLAAQHAASCSMAFIHMLLQESQAGQTVSHAPGAPDDDAPVLIHFAPRE